jgi:hypothetical protein
MKYKSLIILLYISLHIGTQIIGIWDFKNIFFVTSNDWKLFKTLQFLFLISVFDENAPVKKRGADTMVKAPIGFGF